ncbi:MAG: methylmalonyl-CoA mutase family protein [Sediminibacterium sp.]|nr:methylmalonyl-CoA mutase family protein [Sediminibacterium sp.]
MKNKIRIITATSLFDGHDASINIMRRIFQDKGVQVIHLGHNRSAAEVAIAAMEEDVQGIAITSYQGGHIEYFIYLRKILDQAGFQHIKIVGGGGGTILPSEADLLHKNGISKIYLPADGLVLGLEGMIEEVISIFDFSIPRRTSSNLPVFNIDKKVDFRILSQQLTDITLGSKSIKFGKVKNIPILGLTGTGGSGKSTVTDELVRQFLLFNPHKKVAILSVDPSKQKTGGALLGDRIRLNILDHPNVFMRSIATDDNHTVLHKNISNVIQACSCYDFDLIVVESAGVGQNDISITEFCPIRIYVMTPEYGAATQLEKINMLDFAQVVCLNKFDRTGGQDAYLDVCKQYKRNHKLFKSTNHSLPVFPTVAAQFNDLGVARMFNYIVDLFHKEYQTKWLKNTLIDNLQLQYRAIIPSHQKNYLLDIVTHIKKYNNNVESQAKLASLWYCLTKTAAVLTKTPKELTDKIQQTENQINPEYKKFIQHWDTLKQSYSKEYLNFVVRDQIIQLPLTFKTQSGLNLSRIGVPKYNDWGDILQWQLQENLPGKFPFTAGVYELKRANEDPTRMFAGEGCPERTNYRFHYVALGQPAQRLSTAFDSVTLYGEDPEKRDDIFGKIGNAGVNIATLDDAKKLYSGFDLSHPNTSVSMTINGPAPIILAMFLNAAIDQACEKYIFEHKLHNSVEKQRKLIWGKLEMPSYCHPQFDKIPEGHNGLGLALLGLSGDDVLPEDVYHQIKKDVLQKVRGTVQADILKEDQAQNTCIFSTEFALKLMGDIQTYFVDHKVRNFYSVSISGYHIAEAGANPITQLAFTLSNGFTFLEYYIQRGLSIDSFAHNLSFFFSNGVDAEYAVIGRVARRIWAKALKLKYEANERSQKLKYHIQTSGRSLHAMEIDFNDIRTTLQALFAIYDQCNSLHTNAYDEAITTPTTESVRRALAIQLIINKELGTAKFENINQGSFVLEELTDLVEEAVLSEFERLNERGGVLGAMERMYQRSKIQEESLDYENKKHQGDIPIVGVNTFINTNPNTTSIKEVFRSSTKEKNRQINQLKNFQRCHADKATYYLALLQQTVLRQENVFTVLMDAVKYCSLGQIVQCLYQVGGRYRRNM